MFFSRKTILRALLILAVLACGCKADLPKQLAQDASIDFPCTPYADFLVEFTPAGSDSSSPLGVNVLGAPDETTITLTPNSTLTVAFLGIGGIIDKEEADIMVHGTIDGKVATYVGVEETNLNFSGYLTSEIPTIDLADALVTTANYLRLVGISGESTLDAFETVQTICDD